MQIILQTTGESIKRGHGTSSVVWKWEQKCRSERELGWRWSLQLGLSWICGFVWPWASVCDCLRWSSPVTPRLLFSFRVTLGINDKPRKNNTSHDISIHSGSSLLMSSAPLNIILTLEPQSTLIYLHPWPKQFQNWLKLSKHKVQVGFPLLTKKQRKASASKQLSNIVSSMIQQLIEMEDWSSVTYTDEYWISLTDE